jgi:N-acetylmuramoyl-L-alanine amidase
MFAINNHILAGQDPQGNAVVQSPSSNHNGEIRPKFLVFHYTACDVQAATNAFLRKTGANRVSVHLLVDTNGSVTQFVPLNLRAWHAGESEWGGYKDINSHSIGIEVVNYGYLLKSAAGTFFTAEAKLTMNAAEVIEARHRLVQWPWHYWQAFTADQIATCEALAELLTPAYALQDVLGHDDIAPKRKADPGPAFPLSRIRGLALGRDSQQTADGVVYVAVDNLNIRKGAGVSFEKAAPALIRNTQLKVISSGVSDWLHVLSAQEPSVDGWVMAAYTNSELT